MKTLEMPPFRKYVKKLPRHFQQVVLEKEKLAVHILKYGIMAAHRDFPEVLDLKQWQNEIAAKPFNLRQASEYLGISAVTLRRWVKKGRLMACKAGRAYTFHVLDLKRFKREHLTSPACSE